ncbi:S8 family serine peptidase [Micromonospora fiedleri]|uniref:S8 family serine peptidase n=1 Tax=Micromonospora fiedleri TaxID=1157498 RepID=A0ABS1UL97_9ACTN|nr:MULTISPECIES: S8 family serine peptidase [Micromonospora]MBL6277097.1 S8 family serine peptidase [Micromonospora fiedleri]WSK43205.1 S8 family serine peptidase [Micromonospora maris]
MKRRGVLRRTAVAGLALATASSILTVATGGVGMAAPADSARAEVRGSEGTGVVPGRYIVVLKDKQATYSSVRALASTFVKQHGGSVRQVFDSALVGYSAAMDQRQADRLAAHPAVDYVEPVRRLSANGTQSSPPWGLDRLDQYTAKLNKTYKYPNTGSKVTAYILDTGINVKHQDFGGRATMGYDAIDPPPPTPDPEPTDPPVDGVQANANGDCNGHGTHVAGTVGGTKYGVAKGVKLVGVRVLDCEGYGTTEQVIAGVDWVTANAQKPAVANMSLGDVVAIPSLDEAVKRSIASGITYSLAAGNSMMDACKTSPARVPDAITVGATDRVDMRAWFSNYGKCLDVFAPGVSIVSARHDSNTGSVGYSGTSMAAPHVAGAAALLLHSNPSWTPKQVRDRIVTTGIAGAVYDTKGSIDRMLTVGSVTSSRSGFAFKAKSNGKFVTAASTKKALVNNGKSLGTAQRYDFVNAGSGLIALRSKNTGRYVVAPSKGTKPLIASHKTIVTSAKFQIINHTDGTVSLKAKINGKYVTAPKSGTSSLKASKTSIGSSEKFNIEAPAPVISIKSKANGKYVVAGSKPLIASSSKVTKSAKFQIVNIGDGFFGLKALANGKYVTAASKGTKPLIASAKSRGVWESFDFLDYNGDGTVFFRASDNQAVSAGSAGTKQLISNKNIKWFEFELGLGKGEKFTVSAA